MSDNAATARALRADEYESRYLHSVDSPASAEPRRREPRPRAYGNRGHSAAPAGPRAIGGASGVPGRRTVQITGQAPAPRRRPSSSAALVARPDRTAMWAFVLALFLVLMAVATAHAATF